MNRSTIIPIAGGKGGTGKSITTANLAISLARRGRQVVAVDLDLGGSNLHTYLGLPNNLAAIGDYLKSRGGDLNSFLHTTRQPNLRFLPGDGRTPFLANMGEHDKVRLMRQLQQIEADYVLLDLGAGSSYNTLDFFSLSANGILVTNNEKAALLGMLGFMKNFIFRVIDLGLKKYPRGYTAWEAILDRQLDRQAPKMEGIVNEIARTDEGAANEIVRLCNFYRPRLILNAGSHPRDLGDKLHLASDGMASVLGIEAEHFGFVFADPAVSEATESGTTLVNYAPHSLAAKSLTAIAGRIDDLWQEVIADSEERLLRNTENIFQSLWGGER